MADIDVPITRAGFGQTSRRDLWWVQPLVVFLGLSAFMVYATWAASQGDHYRFGPYLSPFYSPELFGDPLHAWFGAKPSWFPGWLPFSPAILILWAPGGFRLTCYYYRGAYYKAFWADPPSCAVGEPRKCFRGEHSFPLILQNLHRYFLYIALPFLVILATDAVEGFLVRRSFRRPRRKPGARHQRDSAGELHPGMPFASTPDGWITGCAIAGSQESLQLRELD